MNAPIREERDGGEDVRVGIWIVGALGDVATTTVLGAHAIARGLAPPTGLVTARRPFLDLDLAALGPDRCDLVFGGHDVREGSPQQAAWALADAGVVPGRLVEALKDDLAAYGARIRPGVAFGSSDLVQRLQSAAARARAAAGQADALAAILRDLEAFKESEGLERMVVVALASTEPRAEVPAALETADAVLAWLDAPAAPIPSSSLYALAAILAGAPYVNFTPSLGITPAGLQELALRRGVPHMGNDGKTGQTLIRTVLAPMFLARNFKVLSWSGFNILGNRDGEVLDEPAANAAKTEGKDSVLSRILGDQLGTSLTRIDYVPSLQDWKAAWDYIHFEGFLGTRMHLELTWRGADSALAAPLVIDLVRLIDLAARGGRKGPQTGLACFFNTPLGVTEYAFPAQMAMLHAYADELARIPATKV